MNKKLFSKKNPLLLKQLYSPKRKNNKKTRSSAIFHLMDYNNAEEEIQNAICEMKKSLILEIKDNNNDLLYKKFKDRLNSKLFY